MDQNKNQNNRPPQGDDKKPKNTIWVTLVITFVIVLLVSSLYNMVRDSKYNEATWNEFRTEMEAGNLA